MVTVSGLTAFGRSVVAVAREKHVTFLAGSIAYNAFVSLVPLLLFFVLALTLVGTGWQERFFELITANVSPAIGRLIEQLFRNQTSGFTGSSVVGLLVLLWGSLKLFRGLDTAFGEIYELEADSSLLDQLTDGGVVLVSLVFSVAAMIAATSVFTAFATAVPELGFVLPVALAVGLVVAFFPMYYIFPNTPVGVREVLPGVAVAAVGWALLQGVFQLYVAASTSGDAGIVTGVMLLLTWLYFSAVVLLLGAVVNAVYGGHAGTSEWTGARGH